MPFGKRSRFSLGRPGRNFNLAQALRRYLVLQHRVTGFAMALFVSVLGITGSLLAFRPLLEHGEAHRRFIHGVGTRLNFGDIATAAERDYPHARTGYFFAPSDPDEPISVRMLPRLDPRTGKPYKDAYEVVLIDPWTGRGLGMGQMEMGTASGLFGIVWDLHKNLALGPLGNTFVGYVAVIWAIDCFVGLYLTFPLRLKHFWRSWSIAWKIKFRSNRIRFIFDLHRATGLWLWPLLFLIAWSGVKYNCTSIYNTTMKTLLPFQSDEEEIRHFSRPPKDAPKLGWAEAYRRCRQEMVNGVKNHGLKILQERSLAYISEFGVYSYGVQTSADFRYGNPISGLYIDGDTGALRELILPDTVRPGNYLGQLADAVHLGDFVSPLYRWFEGAVGLVIVILSFSGILVTTHKWRASRGREIRRRQSSAIPSDGG